MVADRSRIFRCGNCSPFATLEHCRLVVFGNGSLAALAVILRRFRLAPLPAQPLEPQPLHRAAVRARHEIAPLVGRLELALDAAELPDRRRRDQEHLASVRERERARLGQRDRIAFLIGRRGVRVDLVEEEGPASSAAPQPSLRLPGSGCRRRTPSTASCCQRLASPPALLVPSALGSPRSADRSAGASCAWRAPPSAGPPASVPARGA
jgi:hypothetical protein